MMPKKGLALIIAKAKGEHDDDEDEGGEELDTAGLAEELKAARESKDYAAEVEIIMNIVKGLA